MAIMRLHHAQHIAAPLDKVWKHAADFGNAAAWTTELRSSRLLGDAIAPGVERQCELARPLLGHQHIHERLTFIDKPVIQYEVTRPFAMMAHAQNTWTLTPEGDGTLVQINARFQLRWGPIGRELAWLAKPGITRKVRHALRDFAQYVEAA